MYRYDLNTYNPNWSQFGDTLRTYFVKAGLAVSSGGRFIPGFFHGFFRPEETGRKKVEETNLF